jgi:hypothetical protein
MAADDDEFMAQFEGQKEKCFVNGGFIVIVFHPHTYEISRKQCDSPEKILAWVVQLAQKRWVTPTLIQQFGFVAAQAAGVSLDISADEDRSEDGSHGRRPAA